MQRKGEPGSRHHSLRPPLRISPLVLLESLRPLLLNRRPTSPLPLLQLRLPRQPHEIAHNPREPRAVRPDVDPRRAAGLVPAGRQRRREDLVVGEQGDVLKGLEDEVESALRDGRGVEDAVLALLGALEELAHPGVERGEAEQAEGCAGAGEEGGEGYDGGWPWDCGGRVGCFSEALEEFGLQREGFGFEEGEQPEGVVEG